ncbi:Hypothetical Protein FCC1311_073252 [Hondaea fermentalgiana]|uniref:BRCT domain-containing protein n=1 Tax=Hondaea fermentalgiana TaxID=2315210 RepID=A0A2R5GT94_9STRA|nr:Hypothetical Protein FCC1311_073252 [Hondaea fermentalgiana]|eukprot:GBG31104.1 Hypothetical Protein FCC1311_073252 [Hondaea fermentalgiana]
MDPSEASGMAVFTEKRADGTQRSQEAVLLGSYTQMAASTSDEEPAVVVSLFNEVDAKELRLGVYVIQGGSFLLNVENSASPARFADGKPIPLSKNAMLQAGDSFSIGDKLVCNLLAKSEIRTDVKIANLPKAKINASASSDFPPTQICDESHDGSNASVAGSTPAARNPSRSVQFQSPELPATQVLEDESTGVPATPVMTPTTPATRVPPTERQRPAITPTPPPFHASETTTPAAVPATERVVAGTETVRAGTKLKTRESLLSTGPPSTAGDDPGDGWSEGSENLMGVAMNDSDEESANDDEEKNAHHEKEDQPSEDKDEAEKVPDTPEDIPDTIVPDDVSTASESEQQPATSETTTAQPAGDADKLGSDVAKSESTQPAPETDKDAADRADGDDDARAMDLSKTNGDNTLVKSTDTSESVKGVSESDKSTRVDAFEGKNDVEGNINDKQDASTEKAKDEGPASDNMDKEESKDSADSSSKLTADTVEKPDEQQQAESKANLVVGSERAESPANAVEYDAANSATDVKQAETENSVESAENDGPGESTISEEAVNRTTEDKQAKVNVEDNASNAPSDSKESGETKDNTKSTDKSKDVVATKTNDQMDEKRVSEVDDVESGPDDDSDEEDAVALAATQDCDVASVSDDNDEDVQDDKLPNKKDSYEEKDDDEDIESGAQSPDLARVQVGESDEDEDIGGGGGGEEEEDWGPSTQDVSDMDAAGIQSILEKTAIADSEGYFSAKGKATLEERRQRVRQYFWTESQVQRLMDIDDLQEIKDTMTREYGVPSKIISRKRVRAKLLEAFITYLGKHYAESRQHLEGFDSNDGAKGRAKDVKGKGRVEVSSDAVATPRKTRNTDKRTGKAPDTTPRRSTRKAAKAGTEKASEKSDDEDQEEEEEEEEEEEVNTPRATRSARKSAPRTVERKTAAKRAKTSSSDSVRRSTRRKTESSDGESPAHEEKATRKTTKARKTEKIAPAKTRRQAGGVKRAAEAARDEIGDDMSRPAKRAAQGSAARSAAPILPGDVRVQITGIDMDDKAERKRALKCIGAMGGSFAENDPAVSLTHLVAGTGEADAKFPTSRKLLECLALCGRASPRIVNYGWLQDSATNRFPAKNTEEYAPRGFNKKLAQTVDLEQTLARRDARSEPLLAGKMMFLTADAARDFKEMMPMFKNIGLRTTTTSAAKADFALVGGKEDPRKAKRSGPLSGVKMPIRDFSYFTRGLVAYEFDS